MIIVAGGVGAVSMAGDLLAVAMTIGNAAYIVLIRRFADVPVVWAGGASALQLFGVGAVLGSPQNVSAQDALLLILFGLVFAGAVILWTEGTRLIPAAHSALRGTAEIPFAILLAWIVLSELPPTAGFLGGAVILLAATSHASLDIRLDSQ